mmetsp:Transcript_13752/g.23449  ORF Transcript_13752/g.23449 Transcript_13752/m.23449 type:complete len:106 (+) Transcript_13752:934-1251(+)
MDCNMPFLDGYQATQQIREYCSVNDLPQPFIVAVTGHGEEEYVKRALDSGMNELVCKPAHPNQISQLLKQARQIHQPAYNIPTEENIEVNDDDRVVLAMLDKQAF